MIFLFPRFLVIKILRVYQKTLSFDHGFFKYLYPYGYCRFRPTCSEYTINAIEKYGVLKGGVIAFYRVMRCNPFNKGGYNPLK